MTAVGNVSNRKRKEMNDGEKAELTRRCVKRLLERMTAKFLPPIAVDERNSNSPFPQKNKNKNLPLATQVLLTPERRSMVS